MDLADLGDAVDQAGDVLPELFLDLLLRADGVFDRIVEQARDDGRNVESERGHDLGDREGMLQVRLSGLPHLALVRLGGEVVSTADHVHLRAGIIALDVLDEVLDVRDRRGHHSKTPSARA